MCIRDRARRAQLDSWQQRRPRAALPLALHKDSRDGSVMEILQCVVHLHASERGNSERLKRRWRECKRLEAAGQLSNGSVKRQRGHVGAMA
eukprot:2396832-Prymnesium_polylepis.2